MPEVKMRLSEYGRAVTSCNQAWTQLHAAMATIAGTLHHLRDLDVQVGDRPAVATEIIHLLDPLKTKLAKLNS